MPYKEIKLFTAFQEKNIYTFVCILQYEERSCKIALLFSVLQKKRIDWNLLYEKSVMLTSKDAEYTKECGGTIIKFSYPYF